MKRAELIELGDLFFDSLRRHDASVLPWAPGAGFSENGVVLTPGATLWLTTDEAPVYRRDVCSSGGDGLAIQSVVIENGRPVLVNARFRVDRSGQLDELELIVVRDNTGPFGPERLVGATALDVPPVAEPISDAELCEIANGYFNAIEADDGDLVRFTADMTRLENGVGTVNQDSFDGQFYDSETASYSASQQLDNGMFGYITRVRGRRFHTVDVDRGLVGATVFFDHRGDVLSALGKDGQTRDTPENRRMPNSVLLGFVFTIRDRAIAHVEGVYTYVPFGMHGCW